MAKKVHLAHWREGYKGLGYVVDGELVSACSNRDQDTSQWVLAEDLEDVDCRHCLNGAAGNGIVPPKQPEFWAKHPDLAIRFGAINLALPTRET